MLKRITTEPTQRRHNEDVKHDKRRRWISRKREERLVRSRRIGYR